MKIDKRLSEEFGTPLPEPSVHWSWNARDIGGRASEWLVGHLVPITLNSALLALGAVAGRYYPPAVWWLFGIAGAAAFCIAVLFVVVLIANSMDDPMDGGYPGS
jgi:hypothetical protein